MMDVEPKGASPLMPNTKIMTWQRLEGIRLTKLGLNNKYSRHFNVLRQPRAFSEPRTMRRSFDLSGCPAGASQAARQAHDSGPQNAVVIRGGGGPTSTIAPFATSGKPTCGYFFTDATDNKKQKFGIPPSDLVKWRNFTSR